jgi:hypothetical protein
MDKLKQLMKTAQGQLTTTSELLLTEECMLGETDFECWCKLWKVRDFSMNSLSLFLPSQGAPSNRSNLR